MLIRVKNNALSNHMMGNRKLSLEAQSSLRLMLPGTKVFIGDPGYSERKISDWVGMVEAVEGDELVIEMHTEVDMVPGCLAQVEVYGELTDNTVDSISEVRAVTVSGKPARIKGEACQV